MTPAQAMLGLALLALCIRLIGLTSRPLWLDEAFSGWFAERGWHYLWTVVPTFEAHPPFYYSLLKLWTGAFGDSAVGMRSLSVLFGVASIPLIMAAAHEQERQEPSGRPMLRMTMAGFIAACSPMLIAADQEARPYPLLLFSYSLAMLGLLRLIGEFGAGGPGSWRSWLLLGLGTELTLWSHALGILYASCLFLALGPAWLRHGSKERLLRGFAAGTAVALAYLPCALLMMGRAHDWEMNWLRWSWDKLIQLFILYSIPMDVMTVGSVVAAIGMLLLAKRAIVHALIRKGWNSDRALLLLWLGPPLLAALVSALFVPIFLERTLAGTLAPAYVALAGALARIEAPRERRLIAAALAVTLLPAALMTSLRPATEQWNEVANYLSRNAAPQDQLWLYPTDSALPLARTGRTFRAPVRLIPEPFPTLKAHGPIRAGWPAVVSVTHGQAEALAHDPALKRVPTIWLVSRQSGIFDPKGDMPHALAEVRRAGTPQDWGYIEVTPYYVR
jgi:uncharacterized membrane protein